jgi:DNA-binding NtrC family response regulator
LRSTSIGTALADRGGALTPPEIRRITIPVPDLPERAAAPKIAFVCEDDDLTAACTRVLREAGYDVEAREHSGHALLACLEGRVDILIADLASGEGSGPALARRMRRYNPKLKAIYIARAGTVCGAVDNVLVRPFTRDDLLKQLVAAREPEAAGDPRVYF